MLYTANEVNENINSYILEKLKKYNLNGKLNLATIRVGNNSSDISYEKGIIKKFNSLNLNVINYKYEDNISENEFILEIKNIANDKNINSILIFSNIPNHINFEKVKEFIPPFKDVESITSYNISNLIFNNSKYTYCAPMAVMELLDYYDINLESKNVVIVGRGNTVGKPLSILMINKHATVTVCNSKTKNLEEITKRADILVSAIGKAHFIDENFVNAGQIVIDVGVSYVDNKIYGDVNIEKIKDIVKAYTPTPNGISGITTSILAKNVVDMYINHFMN